MAVDSDDPDEEEIEESDLIRSMEDCGRGKDTSLPAGRLYSTLGIFFRCAFLLRRVFSNHCLIC